MFDAKQAITNAVQSALTLFGQHVRGDVVTWAAIDQTTGIDRGSSHWTAFNKRFRRDFLNSTGIALWPVAGVGLQLCTLSFQLKELPLLRQRRAVRQYTKSLNAVRSIPDAELSTHQRMVKSHKIDQLRAARRKVLASLRASNVLAKASSHGLPRTRSA